MKREGWWLGIGVMLFGPLAVFALWWFVPPLLNMTYPKWVAAAMIGSGSLAGVVGVHLLPMRPLRRLALSLTYVPVVVVLTFIGALLLLCTMRPCY